MKNKFPFLSIVIATYNSGNTLPMVLESIEKQTYPIKKIEILIIDGGSTDNTKYIALSYRCRFIINLKVFPAWAKYIGYKKAIGKYIMFLDSDEVIQNPTSIEKKCLFL